MRDIKTQVIFVSILWATLLSVPVFADRFQSTNFTIDAGVTGNSVGGSQSSTSYALTSSGGESVIGNGGGGSYKLGEGYTAQLSESLQVVVQTGGVELYYPFDEGSGLAAANYNAQANPLQAVGTPSWSTGKIGGGIDTSSGVGFESVASTPLALTVLQACAWTKISSTSTDPTIVAQSDATLTTSGMWSLGYASSSTQLKAQINLAGTVYTLTTSSSVGLNNWTHACISYNGTTFRIFLNGSVAASQSVTGSFSSPATKLTVGSRSGSNFLTGSVDELKVYSVAQNPTRIQREYEAQNAGIPAALPLTAVTPGTPQTLNFTITVLSDAFDYTLGVMQDHDLQKGADTIPAVTGTIASPSVWVDGTTKGLGFSLASINPGSQPPQWVGGTAYAALPNSTTTFLTRQRSDSTYIIIVMKLKLDVQSSQPSGDYSNIATWTGTITP